MSIIAPNLRRTWWPVIALVATAVAIAGVLVYAADREAPTGSTVGEAPSIAAPGIEQAKWSIDAFPAGGKPTKAQTKAIHARRDGAISLVRRVYDVLFLRPGRMDAVLKASFSAEAARAFATSKAGLPNGADAVRITRRDAKIGIDIVGASHAAAKVRLVATGTAGAKEWKLGHVANLWLERREGTWRVIAFDVTQEPLK